MQPGDFKDIIYSKDSAGIVTVSYNTPRRKNALSALTFHELWWAAELLEADTTAHAIIITGSPDPESDDITREAFSSGGYFNSDAYDGVSEEVMQQIDLTDIAQKKTTLRLFQCNKPIFAAVNGLAIGGAVTLILAVADQVYMSEHAWLQLPFAKLGISAELGSTYLLPQLLGLQKAKEVLFFPEKIDAQQAVELGLATAALPHGELLEYTRERASLLIPPRGPGLAIREMKHAMHQSQVQALGQALDLENQALAKLFKTVDFSEGISARIERRPAVFRGE